MVIPNLSKLVLVKLSHLRVITEFLTLWFLALGITLLFCDRFVIGICFITISAIQLSTVAVIDNYIDHIVTEKARQSQLKPQARKPNIGMY